MFKLGFCPWCGSPGHIVGGSCVKNRGAQWRCTECGARGPRQSGDFDRDVLPSEAASAAFWGVFSNETEATN